MNGATKVTAMFGVDANRVFYRVDDIRTSNVHVHPDFEPIRPLNDIGQYKMVVKSRENVDF